MAGTTRWATMAGFQAVKLTSINVIYFSVKNHCISSSKDNCSFFLQHTSITYQLMSLITILYVFYYKKMSAKLSGLSQIQLRLSHFTITLILKFLTSGCSSF
jgi:hypothetical protein